MINNTRKTMNFKLYFLILLALTLTPFCFAQTISIHDFESIVSKQDQKTSLGAAAYYFITSKIPIYSISGSAIENDGGNTPTTESFMNKNTREILRVTITNIDLANNVIGFEIRYTAPQNVIEDLKKDLLKNGYKYKKRKNYYIKKKSGKERNIITDSKNSLFVSEFDDQPEIIFTTQKRLD